MVQMKYSNPIAQLLTDAGIPIIPLVNTDQGKCPAAPGWGASGMGLAEVGGKPHLWEDFLDHDLWGLCPAANPGRPLEVLDPDEMEAVVWAEETMPPPIYKVKTSRGEHWYYDMRSEDQTRNRNSFRHKVDIKACGGYVRAVSVEAVQGLLAALSTTPVDYSGHDKIRELWPQRESRTKKCTAVKTSTRPLYALVNKGAPLPLDCTVELVDGSELRLADMSSGDHRPCHAYGRDDRHPSAFVKAMDDGTGRVFMFDAATGATHWWVGRLKCSENSAAPTIELGPTQWASDVLSEHSGKRGVLIAQAPFATGKTTHGHALAAKAAKLLVLAPEVLLVHSLAGARNCGSYNDEDLSNPRMVVTPHSAYTIPLIVRDLVLIEEGVAIARSIVDRTAKGRGRQRFIDIINILSMTEVAEISDADMEPDMATWWGRVAVLAGHPPAKYIRLSGHERPRTTKIMDDREALHTRFMEDVLDYTKGQGTLAFYTSRASDARTQARLVQEARPDLNVLVLTSKTSKDHEELLKDFNNLADYDVVIYNNTLRSGASIDREICRVYVDAAFNKVAVGDVCQAILRWRNVVDTTVCCYVALGTGVSRTLDSCDIRREALTNAQQTNKLVDNSAISLDWEPNATEQAPATEVDELILDLWVMLERQARAEAMDRRGEFVRACQRHKWDVIADDTTIDDAGREAAKEARSEAHKAVQAEDHAAVLAAPVITGEKHCELSKAHRLTMTDRATLEAADIRVFYGREPEKDTVDGGLKLREKISEFVRVEAAMEGDIGPAAIVDRGQRKWAPHERGHYIQRARFLANACNAAGLNLRDGGEIGPKWSAWCEKNLALLRVILRTSAQDPTRLFGRLVKYLGGTCKRRYKTIGDQRMAVPAADFSRTWELSERQRQVAQEEIASVRNITQQVLAAVA